MLNVSISRLHYHVRYVVCFLLLFNDQYYPKKVIKGEYVDNVYFGEVRHHYDF